MKRVTKIFKRSHGEPSGSPVIPSSPNSHREKRPKAMEPESSLSGFEDKIKEINRKIIADPFIEHMPVDEDYVKPLLLVIMRHAGLNSPEQQKLFDKRGELKERLMTGWRNKSFEEILKLDDLQCSVSPTKPATCTEVSVRDMQVIQAAWNLPYEGNYHRLLHRNINDMKDVGPYTNICSIVQSSGTGKSQMVDEQAKLVYTIPMNIRDENPHGAYPLPDESLREFFVEVPGDADAVKGRYLALFSSLFSHAADELKRIEPFLQVPSEEQFATKWREKMCDAAYRHNFYADVVAACKMKGKPSKPIIEAMASLERLVKALEQHYKSTNKVKIVVYIDEAHALNIPVRNDAKGRTRLDLLSSAVAEFSRLPLFCLLLSTQSSLRFLAPSSRMATSDRVREHGAELRAPITETPFDCAPNMKISPGNLRLDDLIKVDYLAKWGRPLWWTMLEGYGSEKDETKLTNLVELARAKLLHHHNIRDSHSWLSTLGPIAVVDVLLALDFEPIREQTDRQAELVANHMRTAYSVPQHREYFRSGYPSEPLLAEAAAQQIHRFQSSSRDGLDVMIEILKPAFEHSWIDLGQRGEVVMRLLLMRAYMDAVREDHPGNPPIFSSGCRLVTFINNLFSHELAATVLNSKSDNVEVDTTFHDTFKTSIVRFTHFVKAGDESVLTTEALFAAFARGMAFVCHQTQEYVDFMIPILLKETDALEEAAMSAIMIQVKRHAKARSGSAYAFTQEDVGLFPTSEFGLESARPYLVLVAELTGRKDASQDQEKGKGKESTEPLLLYVSPRPEVIRHPRSIHPRFMFAAYGCSGDLYKSVGTNHNSYEQLLASRNFLHEHPRQNAESRSAVMSLKPFWKYGKDSYHWVESKVLNSS